MVIEKQVTVENQVYDVILSDEQEILLAASAAGKIVVGLWYPEKDGQSLFPARYVVEAGTEVDASYLEHIVRRHSGLPVTIARTERLLIREFTLEDIPFVPQNETAGEGDSVFFDRDLLSAYRKNQYEFFEYGIWALIRLQDGALIGKAGITNLPEPGQVELSYHIFAPYRRHGFALEACRAVLSYARENIPAKIFVRVLPENKASLMVAEKLGFAPVNDGEMVGDGSIVLLKYGQKHER